MKKRFAVICVFLITTIFLTQAVYAKKIAKAVFDDKTDYLILATVSDITDNYVSVDYFDSIRKFNPDPNDKKAVSAKEQLPEKFNIQKFHYSYCTDHADEYNQPKIGDNIFASIQKTGDTYRIKNCAYKVDTVDIKTLNFLVPETMKGEDCMDDIAALAYFAASGGAETKYEFDGGNVYLKRNDENVSIYPNAKLKLPIKYINKNGKVTDGTDNTADVINITPQGTAHNSAFWHLMYGGTALQIGVRRIASAAIIAIGIVLVVSVMYISRRKKNKSKRQAKQK